MIKCLVWYTVLAMALGSGAYAPPVVRHGQAVRYAPGVMQRVARVRKIAPQPHMAAYTYAKNGDMGRLWLDVTGPTGKTLRFLVVDLPQARHKPNLIRRGIVVEMDDASSRIICGAQWGGAARECPVLVVHVDG